MYNSCTYSPDMECWNCGECQNQCRYSTDPYTNNPCRNCGECQNQCINSTDPYTNNLCRNCGECQENDYQYTGSYGGITLISSSYIEVEMDSETYYKLQSICTLKDKSKNEFVREIIEEKIMNIDVVKYVEELSKPDTNKKSDGRISSYSKESIEIKKKDLDTETAKRLTIFAGAYKKPKNSYSYDPISDIASELFNEKIKEIDLIELVKEEYGN